MENKTGEVCVCEKISGPFLLFSQRCSFVLGLQLTHFVTVIRIMDLAECLRCNLEVSPFDAFLVMS